MSGLAHASIRTPMGRLVLVGSERGLVRIGLPSDPEDEVIAMVEAAASSRSTHDRERLAVPLCELEEYFAGERREFTMPLDLPPGDGFRRRALEAMFRIPYGQTISYGELAARAGNPAAFRAAGQACATNPLPIVLPCHRVLRSDGSLNWYSGGLQYKELLLRLEGAIL